MRTTKYCRGCHDDFYNGKNEISVMVCWHLKTAKLVTRYRQGWWDTPPEAGGPPREKVRVPTCYWQPGKAAFKENA